MGTVVEAATSQKQLEQRGLTKESYLESQEQSEEEQPGREEGTEPEPLSPEERMNQLDEEADIAADFVEGLLDAMDLPGDLEIDLNLQIDRACMPVSA
jgi:spoIIIJ-associated protein